MSRRSSASDCWRRTTKGTEVLEAVYAQESANFKTLFDFVDGAKTYRNFTDETHFVGTYPFVSYQFPSLPSRDRGHLRPQRLRGPQQLRR